jgi:hypothetical protein
MRPCFPCNLIKKNFRSRELDVNSNKVCNELALSPYNLYSFPNIIRAIKSRKVSWSGLDARMKKERKETWT